MPVDDLGFVPHAAPVDDGLGFVPSQVRVRTPQETEAALRSRYPEAYKPTPSVTGQVLRGAGKALGKAGVGLLGPVSSALDVANDIQRLRGQPGPLNALEPQGPGEEAGGHFFDAAAMAAGLPASSLKAGVAVPAKAVSGAVEGYRGWQEGRAVSKAVQSERIRRMAKEALDGPPQPPTVTPRRVNPPAQTGSNNRTPLPAPPVTAAPPPVTGFRGAPPPRQQFAPPAERGSNAPPIPPAPAAVEAGPPPLNWNRPAKPPAAPTKLPNPAGPRRGPELPTKWNTPETATEAGPPTPPEPTPQAGPPTPPAMEPQAGPPQPPKPQGGAETPPPNTITSGAGRSAYDNAPGKFATTEEVTQFAKTNGVSYEEAAKGFAQAGNKVLDRGGLFREIHDPRYGNVAGHPEIKAQFSKMYPQIQSMSQATPAQLATFLRQVILKQAMGEFAKGGVIVPAGKERVRGMAHRWGPKGRR